MVATMKVTVLRPDELGPSEEKLWREFQELSPGTAFPSLSLPYARAVCRVDESGRVAVVEDGGEIRAFLPYSQEGNRVAATLGGTQTTFDGLVSADASVDLKAVIRGAGLRGWRFSRVPAEQRALDPYRYEGSHHVASVYFADLSGGYDAYARGLSKSGRDQIASALRRRRALEREMGDISLEWASRDSSHLSALIDWKSAQFESFGNWLRAPANLALVRALAAIEGEDCSCVTSVLHVAAKPISISLNLWRGRILCQYISAFDPEYSRFSPGTLNTLALFEAAAERGVEIIDFGYGNDRWKPRFSSGVKTVSGGGVWTSRLGGAARSLYRKVRFRDERHELDARQ
jgi:CelD/BcsL family acetyltransferase involved in cellulose biosynthesis